MHPICSSRLVIAAWILAHTVLTGPACAVEEDPLSLLDDLRILTVLATPQEVGPNEAVTLTPLVWTPPGIAVSSQAWSLCPFSLGPEAAFACAVPQCEVPLAGEPDGTVAAIPFDAVAACVEALAAAGDDAVSPSAWRDPPESVEVAFRYTVTADDGSSRTALRRVTLWLQSEPPERNASPVLAAVEARRGRDGAFGPIASLPPVTAAEEVELRVTLTAESAETYRDARGDLATETPFVTFYATAGRFDADRASGLEATNTWTAKPVEPGSEAAELWVVAHDGRGGEAVGGPFRIAIVPGGSAPR